MMISSRCTIILTLFCVLLKVYDANAFSIHRSNVHKKVQASNAHRWVQAGTTLTARRRSLDDYDDELDDVDEINGSGVLPLLPPTGFSSFDELSNKINLSSSASEEKSSSSSPKSAVVSPKFELQYTCNICETRNTINVSRVAYRAGVVIAICNGCGSNHLIADNLGMIGLDIDTNIEDYFKKIGMDDSVKRVNNDVFFLENLLRIDTTGGSLVGDDGRPVLE